MTPHAEDKEILSRQRPRSRYSIVRRGRPRSDNWTIHTPLMPIKQTSWRRESVFVSRLIGAGGPPSLCLKSVNRRSLPIRRAARPRFGAFKGRNFFLRGHSVENCPIGPMIKGHRLHDSAVKQLISQCQAIEIIAHRAPKRRVPTQALTDLTRRTGAGSGRQERQESAKSPPGERRRRAHDNDAPERATPLAQPVPLEQSRPLCRTVPALRSAHPAMCDPCVTCDDGEGDDVARPEACYALKASYARMSVTHAWCVTHASRLMRR